jgi:hypothetical protein
LSKKPFQKELAMHRLTFDPGQRRVLLLVHNKTSLILKIIVRSGKKSQLFSENTDRYFLQKLFKKPCLIASGMGEIV